MIISVVLATGCLNEQKYSRFVDKKIRKIPSKIMADSTSYLTVKCDTLLRSDTLVTSKVTKSGFVPALLYWQWRKNIECKLNPSVPSTIFINSVLAYADSVKLKEKLNGMRLELSIDSIPSDFSYIHKGYTVILIVGFIMNDFEAILLNRQNLDVTYRILDNNNVVRKGNIRVAGNDLAVKNKVQSTKKFTWYYLDQYTHYMNRLGKTFVEQLSAEL